METRGLHAAFRRARVLLNFLSKFMGKDGRSAWLCYVANFTNRYLDFI
jgi:hypothetical protein